MWLRIVLNHEKEITEKEVLDDDFAERSIDAHIHATPRIDYVLTNTQKIFYHKDIGQTIFVKLLV